MSSDKHQGANKELEGSPALITPVNLESAFMELSKGSKTLVKHAREFSGTLHLVKRRVTELLPLERTLMLKSIGRHCKALGINMEANAHPVSDTPITSGPKVGDARDNILLEIEDHLNGRTDTPLNETDIGLDLASRIANSNSPVFNRESEGDGIIFGAEPSAQEKEEQIEKGMHTGIKIILNEDGLKLDFESSQAAIEGKALAFSDNYISSVRAVLSQCCKGQCAARRPAVTYIGSTDEEVLKRATEALAVAIEFNNGSIGKFFGELTEKAFELAKSMQGNKATDEQLKTSTGLEKILSDKIAGYRSRLPYIDTTFIFNGEWDSVESVGANATTAPAGLEGIVSKLAVEVNSISYDLMIDTYSQNLAKLKEEYGFDLLNVDAELHAGLVALPFIYYRFIKTEVCGLVEHLIDLRKLLKTTQSSLS